MNSTGSTIHCSQRPGPLAVGRRITLLLVYVSLTISVPATTSELPALTNIAAIKRLSGEEAARGHRVRLRVLITVADEAGHCFAEDDSGSIYVNDPHVGGRLRAGQWVEIEGRTAPGAYAPLLNKTAARVLGERPLPEPRRVDFDRLASGQEDCRLVEVRGVVRAVVTGRYWHEVQIAYGGGRVRAQTWEPAMMNWDHMVDAVVCVRGGVGGKFNDRRQLISPMILVGDPNQFIVEDPPPDPAGVPTREAGSLLQYVPGEDYRRRIKLRGVVTHRQGQSLFLRDATRGLEARCTTAPSVEPGDEVEALGFAVMGVYSPVLEDATAHRIRRGQPPKAWRTDAETILSGKHDADLVSLEEQLLDSVWRAGERKLVLQSGNIVFNAFCVGGGDSRSWMPPPNGSHLRLTGVALVDEVRTGPNLGSPVSFRLLLRSPADIQVLTQPSWWTPRRMWNALAGLALAGLAALAWAWSLRRRVRQQTADIARKVQREAVLEERTRIARELHDTLEQQLAGITMQLDTASAQLGPSPETAAASLALARQFSRRSLVEARRSVQDLRSGLLERNDLAGALRQSIETLLAARSIRFDLSVSGSPRRLPALAENHLLRIGQEAVNNAVKHAGASRIDVVLSYEPRQVRLTVRDNGRGFDAAAVAGPGEGHFGLLGMRERAERLGGDLSVNSAPAHGTEVRVTVPVSSE